MLKLLIFVPCDKVIIAEGGQTSLVGVLESVQIGIVDDKALAPDAMIPYKWGVLVLWHREEDVAEPIKCNGRIVFERPDSTEVLHIGAEFEVNNQFRNFRQHVDLPLLSATPGVHQLKLFLAEGDAEEKFIASFPILIEHKAAKHVTMSKVGAQTRMTITNEAS